MTNIIRNTFLFILAFSFSYLNLNAASKDKNMIIMETNQGTIKISLKPAIAPKTCENFIGLVRKGYYNGQILHRVIKGFMIQGGDPTGTGRGGDSIWGGSFKDEFDSKVTFNKAGILAMANAGPNTNRSQFFITTAETPWLNGKHTIFGEVVEGMDVVRKIEHTPTGKADRPDEEQKIVKIYLEKDMQDELTLSLIKPGAVSRFGEIHSMVEKNGLRLAGIKMLTLTRAQAEEFYAEHKEKPFYTSLVEMMVSGPVIAQVLKGPNAISKLRQLMGHVDPKQAGQETIRARFGRDAQKNAIHGSDSPKSAKREIKFFFSKLEIY